MSLTRRHNAKNRHFRLFFPTFTVSDSCLVETLLLDLRQIISPVGCSSYLPQPVGKLHRHLIVLVKECSISIHPVSVSSHQGDSGALVESDKSPGKDQQESTLNLYTWCICVSNEVLFAEQS